MIACILLSCNNQKPETEPKGKAKIGPQELNLTSDIMTPEVLWAMGRIGEYSLSPDHSQIVYNVTYYSVEENRSGSTLYIMNADGAGNRVLSDSDKSEYSPQWRPDGKKIGFLSPNDDGVMQIWEINPDGTGRECISNEADDINGFLYSPDCSQVLFTAVSTTT